MNEIQPCICTLLHIQESIHPQNSACPIQGRNHNSQQFKTMCNGLLPYIYIHRLDYMHIYSFTYQYCNLNEGSGHVVR